MKQKREFTEVINMIQASRANAFQAVNKEWINLYWSIGEYNSKKVECQAWGKSMVVELTAYITR